MTEIRATEIGTVLDWPIVESILNYLYINHEIDSYACTEKEDYESKHFLPKLFTDLSLEREISLEYLMANFFSCILPEIDKSVVETVVLKVCLIKVKGRIFRAFIIIRM